MPTSSGSSGRSSTKSSGASEKPVELVSELEGLCKEWLEPQRLDLVEGRARARPKVINDALWGSIRLHPWEVALLDSRFLQRLRTLRQLGVAHWVFPTAGHSRLEHSLGVLHQMQGLIDGLERNSGLAGDPAVDSLSILLLRIAALVHDAGHAVMSHVSEPFLSDLPQVAQLRSWLKERFSARKRPSASEAFAAVFVCSPAFEVFLQTKQVGADFVVDAREACKRIASFILSGNLDAPRTHLSLLLSGAFDADKLDYMPRDCMMAGIPCPMDVRRLIDKVQIIEVPGAKLPESYSAWIGGPQSARLLALTLGGARALRELAVTRTLLFDKVYWHHKVRVLEIVVRDLLKERAAKSGRTVSDWLRLRDDELLGEDSRAAEQLRGRTLPKRAFVVEPPAEAQLGGSDDAEAGVAEDSGGSEEKPKGLEGVTPASEIGRKWRKLRKEISDRTFETKLRAGAKQAAELLGLPQEELEAFPPTVDFPDQTKLGLDEYAFVGDGPEDFRRDSTQSRERSEWAKRIASAKGHVFAMEGAVLPVFLAADRLLRGCEYGRTVEEGAYASTKLDPEQIKAAVEKLKAAAFYAEVPAQELGAARIRSQREVTLEAFLRAAWPRIETLGVRFGPFQAPGEPPISGKVVASFLRQFESEEIARGALRMLESVDFKDRGYFGRALTEILRREEAAGGVRCVCPLGATGDSSTLLSYLMADVPAELQRPVLPLELALEKGYDRILLWDDFCGAGGHALTVLGQWLSKKLRGMLKEQLAEPLSQARIEELRKQTVRIAFCLGRRSGVEAVKTALPDVGLPNLSIADPVDWVEDGAGCFGEGSTTFKDRVERVQFAEFLRGRTRNSLADRTEREPEPWTQETLEDRLLGYGNAGQLLVFYYNVPTVTVTALWAKGTGWKPLFPRRPKARKA